MQEKELWKNTISCLETELSKATISTFFAGTELASFKGGHAKIRCPNHLSANYLKTRYADFIINTINTLSGSSCSVSFEVRKITPKKVHDLGPIFKTKEQSGLVSTYTFESFVVGLSNQLAVSVAQAVIEQPGNLHNPLFLHSGVGLGKTHLMHAIGNAIKQQNQNTRVLYSPAEQFTNELIKAIQSRRPTSSFRKRFRSVDVLLIDDIQFLAGREATQEEFFNTFNELYLSNKQVVLTSDRHPSEIQRLERRLVSRFSGGMITDIQEPDLDMRIEIIRRKAAEKGATLQEEVLLALAEQISGSIRQLEGILNQILTIASAQNVTPTTELVSGILQNIPQSKKFISPENIVSTVCEHFSTKPETVRSKKRSRDIVLPRQIIAYFLRDLTQLSLQNIGEMLGGRDHTTILHGLEKIENDLTESNFLKNQLEALRVEILGKTS